MNNLISWYSNGFWLASFALILWHYFRDKEGLTKLFQILFVLGISTYAIAFSFLPNNAGPKLILLSKDLILMGVISLVFQLLRNYKHIYWLSVFLLFIVSRMFLSHWQKSSVHSLGDLNKEDDWELLVQLKTQGSLSSLNAVINRYQLLAEPAFSMDERDQTDLDQYFSIEIPASHERDIDQIKAELTDVAEVEWVEDNDLTQAIPDIPVETLRTGFKALTNDPFTDKQWSIELMGWNEVMNLFKSGKILPRKKARIFILDTGIDGKHEDLAGNYESLDAKSDQDEKGHGTHCAGIAAAMTNNAKGISSINPGPEYISITSIKVLGSFGVGTQRDIINGILKASDAGAAVINMSLGGRSLDIRQKAYNEAIAYANKKGVIVVVAAGNDNSDARGFAPANAEGVITVSAIDTLKNKSSFSNSVAFIKNKIAAPGVNIYSTIPRNQYAAFNGTSMAAPYVSGLVGLMKSIRPELTTSQVYEILIQTGTSSTSPETTGPIIHAGKAIEKLIEDRISL